MGTEFIGDASTIGKDLSSQAVGLGTQLRDRGMSAVGQAQQTGMEALQNARNTGQGLWQQGQQGLSAFVKTELDCFVIKCWWKTITKTTNLVDYSGR